MISTPDKLAALCHRARQQVAVALDTEFVWERTYYPALGLVQIGLAEDDVHLVDTLALTGDDLAPLAELLEDPDTEIVLHDALQDLQIMSRATGAMPRNVVDTQRVAGMVGLTATASLQDLVKWGTGVHLDKGATRSNWLRRPLSDEQVSYALDDVRYLLDVRDKLVDEAEARGRIAWIDEEMARYESAADYGESDPMDAVDRVKSRGIGKLDGRARAVLRHVSAWREREARRLNRTRRMVLPDDTLAEIASRQPESERELGRILTDRQSQRFASDILNAVREGQSASPEPRKRRGRPGPDEDRRQAQLSVLQGLVAGQCTLGEVDPQLAATKSQLTALVHAGADANPAEHPVLAGWRGAFVGEALLAFLRGEGAVVLDGREGWPQSR